jgi:hypothetical protein
MDNAELIRENLLRELLDTTSDNFSLQVLGSEDGFVVQVTVSELEKLLATSRGEVRRFGSLNTVAKFIKSLGIDRFEVDIEEYEQGLVRSARPDRAAALKFSHGKAKKTGVRG